jgi:hypothetical protein
MTEGPYYLPLDIVRQDITEGLPGLRIGLARQRRAHLGLRAGPECDRRHLARQHARQLLRFRDTGRQTYMRGIQTTDANGQATFLTDLSRWYPGRTHHIHVKVRPTGGSVATSQFYFDQRFNERVNRIPPYPLHGQATTTNASDGIYNLATQLPLVALSPVPTFEFTAGIP